MECSQRNGRIDGYRLIYYPTGNSGDMESILIDGSYTDTFTIVGLQPRVDYTLNLTAASGNYTLFSEESSIISKLTSTPPGKHQTPLILPIMLKNIITHAAVGFLFQGRLYGNNSIVSLAEIGEGRDALLCVTNKIDCCGGKAVDSDISVEVMWFNGSTTISNETERVLVSPLVGTKPSFTSSLFIHPLIDSDNASNFICQASIHSDSIFIEQSNVGEGSIHIAVQQRSELIIYYH